MTKAAISTGGLVTRISKETAGKLNLLVSVVIPAYNGERTIGAAIQSLLNQTHENWRLRVHDNASTDNTREIVESFDDPRIELIVHDKHVSMCENWQRCLEGGVRGDYFQLFSVDDVLHPSCFETKLREAEKPENRGAVLFSNNRMLVTAADKPLFAIGYAGRACTATLKEVLRGVAKKTNPIGDPSAVLIRASAVQKEKRPFRGQLTADIEFWLRLLEHGDLRHIPETLSYYRIGGITGTQFAKDWRDYCAFYRSAVGGRLNGTPLWYYAGYPRAALRFILRKAVYIAAG